MVTINSDLISGSLKRLEELAKEAEEAKEAKDVHKKELEQLHNNQLEIQKELSVQSAESSTDNALIIEEMQDKLARVEEIESNPFLRVIEPVAGKFSQKFSRSKLLDDIGTDETRLNLNRAQDGLTIQDAKSKLDEIDLRKEIADNKLAGEQSDVSAVATIIAAEDQKIATQQSLVAAILTSGSDEDIQDMVDRGFATQQQADDTKQIRRSETITAARQEIALAADRRTEKKAALQRMDDASLATAVEDGTATAREVVEEEGRRINMDVTSHQLRASFELNTKNEEELDALAEADKTGTPSAIPGVTETTVTKEKQARKKTAGEAADAKSDLLRNKELIKTSVEKNEIRFLSLMSEPDVQTLLETATANAKLPADKQQPLIVKDRDGKEITLTTINLEIIRAKMQTLSAAQFEDATIAALATGANTAIDSNLKNAANMVGIQISPDMKREDILEAIIATGDLAPDVESQYKIALQQSRLAVTDFSNNIKASSEALGQASANASEATAKLEQEKLDEHPKAVQPAMKRFFRNGKIVNNQDAINLLAIGNQERTGIAAYDSAIDIVSSFIKGIDTDGTENDADKLTRLFDAKDITTAEQTATALETISGQSAIHDAMAQPISATLIIETWARALDTLNLPKMAEGVRAGTLGTKGGTQPFSERNVLDFVTENQVEFDTNTLTAKVRELGRTAGTDIFGNKVSTQNELVASLNKLLFNNDIDGFASQWINQGIFDATTGIDLDEARKVKGTRELDLFTETVISPQI